MTKKNPHRKIGEGTGNHVLIKAIPGRNRYAPGQYQCSCGKEFTGMNKWERHRYDENRAQRRKEKE